ncbi:MAG: oxidoreductase domain-containing protein [bacterium]|nr:MAG: oxidoreductase domain-containing protein [bacterium]
MPHNSLPPLKVGVAGAGVMGRNHARVLSDIRDFDLTAVFDPDVATAEGIAALTSSPQVWTQRWSPRRTGTMRTSALPCSRPACMCLSKSRSPPLSPTPSG